MPEQEKSTTGDHNSVTHEAAPEAGQPAVAKGASKRGVLLRVDYPHTSFDLSAQKLPSVDNAGVYVTADQADSIMTLAHKYGVPVYKVEEK